MNGEGGRFQPLSPAVYFVATPIGNARDITLRALDILASVDVIAAEDTRRTRHLLEIHGIALNGRPLIAYHDHNGARVRPQLLKALEQGKSVAYVSDAGTPLVADPGFALGRAAQEAGFAVTAVPGASAALAALTVSGLPSDRFLFMGFLPSTAGARKKTLREIVNVQATVIFFESAKRIHKSLEDMRQELGTERQGAVCRELTKKFEEILRGSLDELCQKLANRTLKGELVVVVGRPAVPAPQETEQQMEAALVNALKTMTLKDAAAQVATDLGLPRRRVYQRALELERAR